MNFIIIAWDPEVADEPLFFVLSESCLSCLNSNFQVYYSAFVRNFNLLVPTVLYKGTLGVPIVQVTSKYVCAKQYCLTILRVTCTHGTHSNTSLVK